jgi:hypothetical protein
MISGRLKSALMFVCLHAALICAFSHCSLVCGATCALTTKEARLLVQNTPKVLQSKNSNRCPRIELLWKDERTAHFQARSTCNTQGSGLLGNFTVDLISGSIYTDIDLEHAVDSDNLKDLTKRLLRWRR